MDYSYLKGKIVEKCGNQTNFAKQLNLSNQSLSAKLNNKVKFSQEEISLTIEILSLNDEELKKCFFMRTL